MEASKILNGVAICLIVGMVGWSFSTTNDLQVKVEKLVSQEDLEKALEKNNKQIERIIENAILKSKLNE